MGLLLAMGGCDSTEIDPFENDQKYFTIYGYLDELSQNHSVRVIPVTRFPHRIDSPIDDDAQIDAHVYSTDLETGRRIRWNHSLQRLDDGSYGHIFSANFIVRPGRTYRLEVIRADSMITSAETTIPRFVTPVPIPAERPFPFLANLDDGYKSEIEITGVASPWDIILSYDLERTDFRNLRLPYGRAGHRTPEGNWKFSIDTALDAARIRDMKGLTPTDSLPPFFALVLQVRVLDANWDPPQGVFDPEILAQPGVLSNVKNGFGTWGGVGLYHYVWEKPFPLPF